MSKTDRTPPLPDQLREDFVSRGLVVLGPEHLGIDASVHSRIFAAERAAFSAKTRIDAGVVPEILEVIESPGVVAACDVLLGPDWGIVPFTHNSPFVSGPRDQHWHKDDNGPFNARWQRHQHAVQIEMLYYPQVVEPDMGPTATIPYSQYWTFNHEENHDNFAGADHLDFNYQLEGMETVSVAGPQSVYDFEEVRAGRTAHDVRMRGAVNSMGWPLMEQFEVAPLRAGSVVLYSHNLFHRGNHRRDHHAIWKDRPRFMWRFWLYRTSPPKRLLSAPEVADWPTSGNDRLTGVALDQVDQDITALWDWQDHWIQVGEPPAPSIDEDVESLADQLELSGEESEPQRIGAAYRLARAEDRSRALTVLERALYRDRESVRRAATIGLIAIGHEATPIFLAATKTAQKWVRRAGAYGLGDSASATDAVLDALRVGLLKDESVFVRSVAAHAVGALVSRTQGSEADSVWLGDAVDVLLASLDQEQDRPSMNLAQGRSIKLVRPTDECDVCEGIGIDYGVERFERVRSAVRENALWALVIIATHGRHLGESVVERLADTLETIAAGDPNVFSTGLALDALQRLARATAREDLHQRVDIQLTTADLRSWDSLVRSGVPLERAREIETRHRARGEAAF